MKLALDKTMTEEERSKAKNLLILLGLTDAEAEALLKSKEPKIKQPKPKKKAYKEYILSRTFICNTCSSKFERYFHMQQPEEVSALVSKPISPEAVEELSLPTKKDWSRPPTCHRCTENLILLTKEDLVILLLETINEREKYKNA